ncbi:MAG: UPF0158 family protein, partial [Imperialibacter sp.]
LDCPPQFIILISPWLSASGSGAASNSHTHFTEALGSIVFRTEMTPTDEHIKEIADLLDCGQICFFHKPTGSIEHYSDPEGEYFDPEPWKEIMKAIEADLDNYIRFDKMDSRQGFRVMEDFARSLTDSNFQSRLLEILAQRKPFSKFKFAVDNSKYRQTWFDFRDQANFEWVRQQLH